MSNYLISNGNLLDCTGAKLKKNTSVFVEGNRIAKIGAAAEVRKFAEGKTYAEIVEGPQPRIAAVCAGSGPRNVHKTHLAYKPEHAVDLDTGAVVAAELHPADEGDTTLRCRR